MSIVAEEESKVNKIDQFLNWRLEKTQRKKNSAHHFIFKTINMQNKESHRKKKPQITNNSKPISTAPDLSVETSQDITA